jgi:hypothetical protein
MGEVSHMEHITKDKEDKRSQEATDDQYEKLEDLRCWRPDIILGSLALVHA